MEGGRPEHRGQGSRYKRAIGDGLKGDLRSINQYQTFCPDSASCNLCEFKWTVQEAEIYLCASSRVSYTSRSGWKEIILGMT